ncbi:MAG: SsrA-binding protein SmpB [Cardiobacteriaceae bacterium]|nr:SsrA-binding protein SmpB [Cardiobacteriaceae bacterium]
MKKKAPPSNQIASNKKALHDFFLEEHFEAGIALQGWEVKSLRAGRIQLKDSYVLIKNGEVYLIGAIITPLASASSHIVPESQRSRKLLLHRNQIAKLIIATEREGYTVTAVNMYWKNSFVKVNIAIAKGKKEFDKRHSEKERDWNREKARIMKAHK